MDTPDPNATVSHEQDGRVLSGVGTSVEKLAETMDRHTPEEPTPAVAPAAGAPEAVAAPPKVSKGRERFSELAKQRDEAKTRAEAAERERDELRARLSAPPTAVHSPEPVRMPSAQPVVAPSVQPGAGQTRPQPLEDEIGTKYKSYADFVVDSARWVQEQSSSDVQAQIRASIEADRASRSFNDLVESTRAKGRGTYADFDAVLANGPGAMVPLGSFDKVQAIIHHPQSEHLQYAIMKDAGLAQRLSQMGPIEFGLTLSAIAPSSPAASPASTGVSGSVTPPPPMQPVGSGSKTTVTPSAELPKRGFDFDKSGYREKRAAERKVARRW